MDNGRTVGNSDDGEGKVEQALEDVGSLAADLLPVRGLEDFAEAFSVDGIHEGISRAGDDQCAVIAVEGDLLKSAGQILVGLAREGDRSAVGVETQSQYAVIRALESEVFVAREVARGSGVGGHCLSLSKEKMYALRGSRSKWTG